MRFSGSPNPAEATHLPTFRLNPTCSMEKVGSVQVNLHELLIHLIRNPRRKREVVILFLQRRAGNVSEEVENEKLKVL